MVDRSKEIELIWKELQEAKKIMWSYPLIELQRVKPTKGKMIRIYCNGETEGLDENEDELYALTCYAYASLDRFIVLIRKLSEALMFGWPPIQQGGSNASSKDAGLNEGASQDSTA